MQLFLIAEIGINHNGDVALAKQIIKSAADAGFNAVKFQKRTINKVYTREFLDQPRDSPWGTTQREQKEGLEFGRDEYQEIDAYCRDSGVLWSASAWDLDALDFLDEFDLSFNKVASAMLGHRAMLEKIAEQKRRTFISTGMATLQEIDDVVELFRAKDCPFELMHCCSVYPMKEDEANLLCIPMLRERYDCKVGYSGHESSLQKVSVAAVSLGATSLERHVTVDRAMYGSDQSASIETASLRAYAETLRAVNGILGNGEKVISKREMAVREKLWRTGDENNH